MNFSFDTFKSFLLSVVPWLILAMAILVEGFLTPMPVLGSVQIFLVLGWLYYWSIYQPTLFPPVMAFFVGIIIDVLKDTPLGMTSALYILSLLIIRSQRRFLMGQNFMVQWLCFAIVCACFATGQWLGFSLLRWVMLDGIDFLLNAVLSIFVFPLWVLVAIALHFQINPEGRKKL